MENIDVKYKIKNQEVVNALNNRYFMTISNHPYEGLDGLFLIDLLGRYRYDYRIKVNHTVTLDNNSIKVIRKPIKPEKERIQGVKAVLRHGEASLPVGISPPEAIRNIKLRIAVYRK